MSSFTYHAAGAPAPGPFMPGDFILVRGRGFVPWGIRVGEHIKFWRRHQRQFARVSHAALLVSTSGDLIQAGGNGIGTGHVNDYEDVEYWVVHIDADDHDREQMVAFAHATLGVKYGYATIVCIVVRLLTGLRIMFGNDHQYICSAHVAHTLTRGTYIWPEDPDVIMPADLACYFNVAA